MRYFPDQTARRGRGAPSGDDHFGRDILKHDMSGRANLLSRWPFVAWWGRNGLWLACRLAFRGGGQTRGSLVDEIIMAAGN